MLARSTKRYRYRLSASPLHFSNQSINQYNSSQNINTLIINKNSFQGSSRESNNRRNNHSVIEECEISNIVEGTSKTCNPYHQCNYDKDLPSYIRNLKYKEPLLCSSVLIIQNLSSSRQYQCSTILLLSKNRQHVRT